MNTNDVTCMCYRQASGMHLRPLTFYTGSTIYTRSFKYHIIRYTLLNKIKSYYKYTLHKYVYLLIKLINYYFCKLQFFLRNGEYNNQLLTSWLPTVNVCEAFDIDTGTQNFQSIQR